MSVSQYCSHMGQAGIAAFIFHTIGCQERGSCPILIEGADNLNVT